MKPLICFFVRGKASPFSRVSCCVVVFLLFACGLMRPCFASKFRQRDAAGVYLTRDGHLLRVLAQHTPGTYWIDGYQMSISKQTQICWHHSALRFGEILNWAAQPVSKLEMTSPCNIAALANLGKTAWLQYLGMEDFNYFTPLLKVSATRIDVWEKSDSEQVATRTPATPDWQTLCASSSPHELHYPNEDSIRVICDANISNYVQNVYSSLLQPSATTHDAPTTKGEVPRFYIVTRFQVSHKDDFESIDGFEARCNEYGGGCAYEHPHIHSTVREIVYAPDGSVLIPDIALAHLTNEAELAALLSYSIAATDQHLIGHLFRVQRFKGNAWTLGYQASGRENADWTGSFIRGLNEQILRLGIRRMYLADFDIRYAPYTWAAEQGKQIHGPIEESQKHMPWYAYYGFNIINQLYPDLDYGKLKTGKAEYQQFLNELHGADPEAFEKK